MLVSSVPDKVMNRSHISFKISVWLGSGIIGLFCNYNWILNPDIGSFDSWLVQLQNWILTPDIGSFDSWLVQLQNWILTPDIDSFDPRLEVRRPIAKA